TAKWETQLDRPCSCEVEAEELWGIDRPGGVLIRIKDQTVDIVDETRAVDRVSDAGQTGTVGSVGWNPRIHVYDPATSLVNAQLECVTEDLTVLPEDTPDFSFTYPPPVSTVEVSFDDDGIATVSWVPPDSKN